MSIVDGPRFERMKKFNINELYKLAGKKGEEKKGEGEGGDASKSAEAEEATRGGETGDGKDGKSGNGTSEGGSKLTSGE
jgi:hypothetical protein